MKKYPSLLNDLAHLQEELILNPKSGVSLGGNAYKIRLQIKSKGHGKSGGARVISYLETEIIGQLNYTEKETTVNLVTIYDKGNIETLTDKELKGLISSIHD